MGNARKNPILLRFQEKHDLLAKTRIYEGFYASTISMFLTIPDIQTVVQCLHIRRKFAKIDLSSTKLQIRLDSTKYCNNLKKKKKEKLEIGKCKVKCMIQVCTESSHTVGY